MGAIRIGFAALLLTLVVSCGVDDELSMVKDLDPQQWRDAVEFEIPNSDTLSLRDISLFVRYQPSRERVDSLPLHLVTIAPDGVRVVEQVTIYVPRRSGDMWRRRLYGEAMYRKDVKLVQSGEYRVLIYPRQATYGVESVGLTLKKSK